MPQLTRALARWPFASVALIALTVFLLALGSIELTRVGGHVAAVWPANAVVVAVLLRSARRRWGPLIAASVAGCLLANLVGGGDGRVAAGLALANGIEIVACAGAVRRILGPRPDLTQLDALFVFILCSALAPVLSAALAAFWLAYVTHADVWRSAADWYVPDVLGLLIVAPALASVRLPRLRDAVSPPAIGRRWLPLAAVAGALAINCLQSDAPLQVLLMLSLTYCGVELGVAAAALGILVTAVVGVSMTLAGRGPAMIVDGGMLARLHAVQAFLLMQTLIVLPVSSLIARKRRVEAALTASLTDAVAAREALSESEQKLRGLFELAPIGIALTTMGGRFVEFNPAFADLCGYDETELKALDYWTLTPPEYAEDEARQLASLAATGRYGPYTKEYVRKDGSRVPLSLSGVLLEAPDGTQFIWSIVKDITAQLGHEAVLIEARNTAEAAAAVKTEFLANMSHEIRTPLTSILGFTKLLSDRPELSDVARSHVGRISVAGRALLAIVNDILDFSKLEAGEVSLKPRRTCPAEIVRETLDLFQTQAEAKGIVLGTSGALDLPELVRLDPDRVRQVLVNLVGNAVKFTEKGAVTVACAYDPASARLRFEVRDSGPGLTEDQQLKLFQRFSQVDGSTTRKHGGTGLGLAICRALVDAMGGEIGVDSAPGKGSVFHFWTPAPPVEAEEHPLAPGQTTTVEGLRVLVVDDSAANRELARTFLEALGANVALADGGGSALEQAATTPFDIILMDLRMPGLDGPMAATRIRATSGPNQNVPILAFTADVRAELDDSRVQVFDGVVRKPIVAAELVTTIAACLAPADSAVAALPRQVTVV